MWLYDTAFPLTWPSHIVTFLLLVRFSLNMSAPPRVNYGDVSSTSYTPGAPVHTSGTGTGAGNTTLTNISLVGGVHAVTSPDEIHNLERFAINQGIKMAMQNTIVTSPDGLTVRPFLPDVDFVDGNNNAVGKREWFQPWSGTYMNTSAGVATTIYQTGNAVRYDRKVYVFWGITYTAVGNQRSAGIVDTASIVFRDGANNTFDIWSPQRLDTNDALYAYAPILYPNTRTCTIQFVPKYAASGAFENIVLIGAVIEPDGDNIQGQRALHV